MNTKFIYVIVGVWFFAIAAAFTGIWWYKATPGVHHAAPATWPSASAIRPAANVANVVLFAHPQCPCTRASISELERLATLLGERARIHVVMVEPADAPDGFERGSIYARAEAIPRADLFIDRGEVEAGRFGAATSGAAVVYSAAGELLFEGGLTFARGHSGGPAPLRIRDLVIGRSTTKTKRAMPVFGCGLADPEMAEEE